MCKKEDEEYQNEGSILKGWNFLFHVATYDLVKKCDTV
jgi:hypothetical protein